MRKIRKFGMALAMAAFVATGMMASSTSLYAAGPGSGNGQSKTVLCTLLKKAIDNANAIGADDLAAALTDQFNALGCSAGE